MTYDKNRPGPGEIDKRIEAAKKALQRREMILANPSKNVGEINDLELGDTSELQPLIIKLLEEISLSDYVGKRPPTRSYERSIKDCELWPFSFMSKELGKRMYLKFAIKNGRFFLVSIHKDKKK
ncbi:MAG: hypothetical protein AAGE99_03195 [Chlamydiota bacterium]